MFKDTPFIVILGLAVVDGIIGGCMLDWNKVFVIVRMRLILHGQETKRDGRLGYRDLKLRKQNHTTSVYAYFIRGYCLFPTFHS